MNKKGIFQIILDFIPLKLRNIIRHIPLVKQLQQLVLKKYLNGKEFDALISAGPAKGLNFPVTLPQDKLMWIGTWELDFSETLNKQIVPDWICYDIGGYKGYYSGIMALRGAKEVLVFEPMPENAEKIKKLIKLNSELPIKLYELAISEKTGDSFFQMMPEQTMGKLESSLFQKEANAEKSIKVKTASLDDLIEDHFPEPDFIKIDVEGAEEFVLKGAQKLLQRKKPMLMIEIHSPEIGRQCMEILKPHYNFLKVLETGKHPDFGVPEICHYLAYN